MNFPFYLSIYNIAIDSEVGRQKIVNIFYVLYTKIDKYVKMLGIEMKNILLNLIPKTFQNTNNL